MGTSKTATKSKIGHHLLIGLIVAGLSLVASAPTVAAHDCQGEDPENLCGPCTEGNHDHRFPNGSSYCKSSEDEEEPSTLGQVKGEVEWAVDQACRILTCSGGNPDVNVVQ